MEVIFYEPALWGHSNLFSLAESTEKRRRLSFTFPFYPRPTRSIRSLALIVNR